MGKPRRVAIIGAGISGLSAAHFLRKAASERGLDIRVEILEKSNRLGGVIQSEETRGFLLEWGPENFVSYRSQTPQLIRDLGLTAEVIGSSDRQRRVFILHDSVLQPLPESMGFLIPTGLGALWSTSLLSVPGKIRVLLEPFISRSSGDLSIHSFLKRRVGSEMTDKVVGPVLGAIQGGDIRKLSVLSALPDMYRMEQTYGSLWKGMRAVSSRRPSSSQSLFLTMKRGMSRLIHGLVEELSDVSIHRNVHKLRLRGDSGGFRVVSPKFDQVFDSVILATPAPAAALVLEPLNRRMGEMLGEIDYSSTTMVYLAYRRSEFSHPLNGFGFVVPDSETSILRACTWVSSKFEGRCPAEAVLLRCSLRSGGSADPSLSADTEVTEAAQLEIERLLGIACRPIFSKVHHLRQAIPQPLVGHDARLAQIKKLLDQHPGLYLCGAFLSGAGIPQCIETAQQAAEQSIDFLCSSEPV